MARFKQTVATKIFDFPILVPLRVIPPKKSFGSLSLLIRARWTEIENIGCNGQFETRQYLVRLVS